MNSKIAVIEINDRNLKGQLSIYDSCSILRPGYIVRAGGPQELLVKSLKGKFGKTEQAYQVAIVLRKVDLGTDSASIFKYPTIAPPPDDIRKKIIEIIRKAVSVHFNISYTPERNPVVLAKKIPVKFAQIRGQR